MTSPQVAFAPADPDFAERVAATFARQQFMRTIEARLERVEPGGVEIHVPYSANLTQQHGFMHAAVVTAALDTACGCAALSLMPADAEVLTAELKVNLLAPASGEQLQVRGAVVRPGRTLTVCHGDAFMADGESKRYVATMLATMVQRAGQGPRT